MRNKCKICKMIISKNKNKLINYKLKYNNISKN